MLSCNNNVYIKFKIKNESKFILKSLIIKISGGSVILCKDLRPNEFIKLKLDMTGIQKIDGNYSIGYCINDSNVIHHFGYYTNGYPINNLYKININLDTILIKEN